MGYFYQHLNQLERDQISILDAGGISMGCLYINVINQNIRNSRSVKYCRYILSRHFNSATTHFLISNNLY